MTEFERITESTETLAAFLASLPCIEGPWNEAFHERFCNYCPAVEAGRGQSMGGTGGSEPRHPDFYSGNAGDRRESPCGTGVRCMSVCRGCGRAIDWIKTTAGKNMPVDPAPVFVIEGGGNDRFVTDEGAVIVGRVARPEEESRDLPVAFVPHWKTCPNAGDFRRSGRG